MSINAEGFYLELEGCIPGRTRIAGPLHMMRIHGDVNCVKMDVSYLLIFSIVSVLLNRVV